MVIKFCPKCKGILILAPRAYPEKSSKKISTNGKRGKAICNTCGYVRDSKGILSSSEKIPEQEERGEGAIKGENTFATYDHKCEKCGHNKSQVIDCGVFYSDEDNLIFLKCGKCGFSERVGKKVS